MTPNLNRSLLLGMLLSVIWFLVMIAYSHM